MVKLPRSQHRRLKRALQQERNPLMRQRIQMVVLRETGMTQPEIADVTGVSLSTVNRAHMAYDRGGLEGLKPKPSGGRINQNMTVAQEKALLDRFAKVAGAGQMLNIHDLKAAYEEAIGRPTSNSVVYSLLARHDWRKITPRPHHPKRDIEAQKRFKKKLSTRGQESPEGRRRAGPSVTDHVH